MYFISLAILAASALSASGNPIPNPFRALAIRDHCEPCPPETSYSITHQYDWKSPFILIEGVSCQNVPDSGQAPCQLSAGYEYSVGVSVDVGADLGLDFAEIFSAGISASVSIEQSQSVSASVTVTCPDNVQCGFMHQDAVHIVEGYQTVTQDCALGCGFSGQISNDYYVVEFVKTGDNGFPITEVMACGCPDSDLSQMPAGMYACPSSCS